MVFTGDTLARSESPVNSVLPVTCATIGDMEEIDIAMLEAFLNSHDNGGPDWFVPETPVLFDEWAHGEAPVRGAHDCPDAAAVAAAKCIRELMRDHVVPADEVTVARDVRDGFMAMMLDGEPDALDQLMRRLPVRLRVGVGSGVGIEPSEGGPLGVTAAAMLSAQRLVVSGSWPRLRLCRNEDCHWAFFDRSKNGSRVWCSMGACGARAKARAYRERRRGQ